MAVDPIGQTPPPESPVTGTETRTRTPTSPDNYNEVYPTQTDNWRFPVAGTTQYSNSFTVPRDNSTGIHGAIDVYAAYNSPIVCPVNGTVLEARWFGDGGNGVRILGDDGIIYYFAHMAGEANVAQDERVTAGYMVGRVGDSGNAKGTSPHLHLKMTKGSALVNPFNFLENGSDAYQNLGQDSQGNWGSGEGFGGSMTDTVDKPVILPEGGSFYTVNGVRYVAYSIKDSQGAPQAWVYYMVPGEINSPAGTTMSTEAWEKKTANEGWVKGGSANGFAGVEQGTTWDDHLKTALMNMDIWGTSAMDDPGVLAVIGLFISRPDMSPNELTGRLDDTAWGREHNDKQKRWDDKSPAQQDQELMDNVFALVGTWFTYVGEDLNVMQWDANGDGILTSEEVKAGNPGLYNAAIGWANGSLTERQVVETWIKPEANKVDQSPWMRTIQSEEKAKGAQEVGIESTAQQVETLYRDYGIPISREEALKLGEDIWMNRSSMAELELSLDEQAMALYPGKPKGVKTMTYAQPYMQQYKSLLEVADVGLDDPLVQSAMGNNMTLGDFSTKLREDSRWMETSNARDTHYTQLGALGRQMGF